MGALPKVVDDRFCDGGESVVDAKVIRAGGAKVLRNGFVLDDLRALIVSRRALDFRVDHCSDKQR